MSRNRPKRVNQYRIDNEAFLQAKAGEEGVVVLDNGVIMHGKSARE